MSLNGITKPVFTPTIGNRLLLRHLVFDRDLAICGLCGTDTMALHALIWEVEQNCSYVTFARLKTLLSAAASKYPKPLWEADHIVALEDGGKDELANIRTLCLACHRARHLAGDK